MAEGEIPGEAEVVELGAEEPLVCRGCLANAGEMKNMYDWGLNEEFFKITDIKAIRTENISEFLCTNCEDMLMICKRFKSQCQQSNSIMMNWIKTTTSDSSVPQNITRHILTENKLTVILLAPDRLAKVYITCPLDCNEKYIKKRDLLTHLNRKHNYSKDFAVELQYYCSYETCTYSTKFGSKWFAERKFLNQHYNKVHSIKVIECERCNKGFSSETDYARHVPACSKTFQCPMCNKEYASRDRYTVHLLRKHPQIHKEFKMNNKAEKRKSAVLAKNKKKKKESFEDYICDSPKRSSATQTRLDDKIKNDVTLPSWSVPGRSDGLEIKTDEISTQTVFEDLLSIKSQTSEDESIFCSETVSLSDIQTQTFPIEFGLSRSNKETVTSETQSPDLSIKETQTCLCLYETPKSGGRYQDGLSSSPCSNNFISTETQTGDLKCCVKSDVLLSFNSTETQTCFDDDTQGSDNIM